MSYEIERGNPEPESKPRSIAPPKATAAKGGRGKKIAHGLVVASATAVLAVYGAGYAATQAAAAQVAAQAGLPTTVTQTATVGGSPATSTATAPASAGTPSTAPTVATSVPAAATAATEPAAASVPTATSTPSATATSATATTSTYKDGTYTGSGVSRHGGIQVQVVIQGGKIVSADITASTTRYPTSRIASLPGEVVAQQSANVDYISGATDSSLAYLQAVANALAQAA